MNHVEKWLQYRDSRRGTYEYRASTRYKAVADKLFSLGLNSDATVLDVGAGTCQFGQYLREQGFRGVYAPVDAVIDGTDLETWACYKTRLFDFSVCIETLEHVEDPIRLLVETLFAARLGCVITTPNPLAVDVLTCDPTHVSRVYPVTLNAMRFNVERHSWFGVPDDTLLAWRQHQ